MSLAGLANADGDNEPEYHLVDVREKKSGVWCMNSGDIALANLPQADGYQKLRPVLLLKTLPGHGDWLACGISSQLWQYLDGWDFLLQQNPPDFINTRLKTESVIHLGFLEAVPQA